MTDDQQPDETTSGPTTSEMLAKLRHIESAAGISSIHNGTMFAQRAEALRPPPVHRHRWAWAQLVSGGVRRVCYDCGIQA